MPKEKEDKGHLNLISDLEELLAEVENYEYHDFKTERATPKMDLVARMDALKDNCIEGRYDNHIYDNENSEQVGKVPPTKKRKRS